MDVSGEYFIPMSRERVWEALNDPAVLAVCIPGCRSLERVSATEMRGLIEAKVGPLKTAFHATIRQSDIDPPEGVVISAEGEGDTARVAGTAKVTLAAEGEGTRLRYLAHGEVGGKLAALRRTAVDAGVKHMADHFFGTFAARLGEGALARVEHVVEEAAHEVADAARAAEERAEVAAGRGVLGGAYTWGLIALAVVIAILILLRWLNP